MLGVILCSQSYVSYFCFQLEMDEELAVLLHCQVGMHPQQEACVKTAGKGNNK